MPCGAPCAAVTLHKILAPRMGHGLYLIDHPLLRLKAA